mmetsp:Transcript_119416/g.380856  ORF Transcript_119416/g.380856 Transcript_119416/m.380856 type:complete len:208 (+) Transcript_119416:319-942(+)
MPGTRPPAACRRRRMGPWAPLGRSPTLMRPPAACGGITQRRPLGRVLPDFRRAASSRAAAASSAAAAQAPSVASPTAATPTAWPAVAMAATQATPATAAGPWRPRRRLATLGRPGRSGRRPRRSRSSTGSTTGPRSSASGGIHTPSCSALAKRCGSARSAPSSRARTSRATARRGLLDEPPVAARGGFAFPSLSLARRISGQHARAP